MTDNAEREPTVPSAEEPASSDADVRVISRRRFGRDAAIAAAAASFAVPSLLKNDAVQAADRTETAKTAAVATAAAGALQHKPQEPFKGLTAEQAAEVEARLANVVHKYGSRFTPAQVNRLRRILAQNERLLAPVRAFAVQNGDPPASVLRITFDEHDQGDSSGHESDKHGGKL
jgi:hypothetical protein